MRRYCPQCRERLGKPNDKQCERCGWGKPDEVADDATEDIRASEPRTADTVGDESAEVERTSQEADAVSLPPGNAVLVSISSRERGTRVASQSEHELLALVDGATSIERLANQLGITTRAAQLIAAGLLERKLVKLRGHIASGMFLAGDRSETE